MCSESKETNEKKKKCEILLNFIPIDFFRSNVEE